jgi:UDP-glucose 4-epimerase
VIQLADAIWRKIRGNDIPLRLAHDEAFEYDVQRRVPDVSKAKEVLGFEATTTLDVMLDEVIPWIENAVKDGSI